MGRKRVRVKTKKKRRGKNLTPEGGNSAKAKKSKGKKRVGKPPKNQP
jgi:hypothetical protein